MTRIFILTAISLILSFSSFEQVYASEELMLEVEKGISSKNTNSTSELSSSFTKHDISEYKEVLKGCFTLTKIEISSLSENITKEEINQIKSKIAVELDKIALYINYDKKVIYLFNQTNKSFQDEFNFIIENEYIVPECVSCDFSNFKLVEKSNNQIILEIINYDEDKRVVMNYFLNN